MATTTRDRMRRDIMCTVRLRAAEDEAIRKAALLAEQRKGEWIRDVLMREAREVIRASGE